MIGLCAAALLQTLQATDLPALGPNQTRTTVVVAEDSRATQAFEPQPEIVDDMLRRAILKLTGKTNLKAAWLSLVTAKDVVGLKVYSGPGPRSGTRPAVVEAVVKGLLEAGLRPTNVIIWDRRLLDLRLAGYDDLAQRYKVTLAGAVDAEFDEGVYYDNPVIGTLVAGDLDFDLHRQTSGRKSYLSKLVTKKLTKIISIAPLLNHNLAGTCGNLYSVAMGSVDNTVRFEASANRLATAVPEIYAKPALSDHVVLNITDALVGQYQGESTSLLHYSAQLDQLWLSKDPVALDVLAIKELDRRRKEKTMEAVDDNAELYKNASFYLELGVDDPAKIRIERPK